MGATGSQTILTKNFKLPDRYQCANCRSNLITVTLNGTSVSTAPKRLVRNKIRVSSRFSSQSTTSASANAIPGISSSGHSSPSSKPEEISIIEMLTKFYDYDFSACQRKDGNSDIVESDSGLTAGQKALLVKKNIPLCLLCSAILQDLYRSFLEFSELRASNSLLSKVHKINHNCQSNKSSLKNCHNIPSASSTPSSASATSSGAKITATAPVPVPCEVRSNANINTDENEYEFILPHPIDSTIYAQKSNRQHCSTMGEEIGETVEQRYEEFPVEPEATDEPEPEEILGIDKNDVEYPLSPNLGVEVDDSMDSQVAEDPNDVNYSTREELETLVDNSSNGNSMEDVTVGRSNGINGRERSPKAVNTVQERSDLDTSDDQEPPVLEPQITLNIQTKKLMGCIICDHCGRTFENLETLQKHMLKLHVGLFKCNTCGKQFSTRDNLQFHKGLIHSQNKIYNCELCSYSSHVKRYVVRHMTRKHKVTNVSIKPTVIEETIEGSCQSSSNFQHYHRSNAMVNSVNFKSTDIQESFSKTPGSFSTVSGESR